MRQLVKDHAFIFDMDGTLFQTETLAIPAFYRTFDRLVEQGLYSGTFPTEEQIQSSFGMTTKELWIHLLPDANEEVRKQADQWMLEEELHLLQQGKGALYPGVTSVLHQLNEVGWPLFIASNGMGAYVRRIVEVHGLRSLFKGIYTAGDYQTDAKENLVKILMTEHHITGGYMVGDRSSDVRAGKKNGLTVIGCKYADFPQFGQEMELKEADVIIESFLDLLKI